MRVSAKSAILLAFLCLVCMSCGPYVDYTHVAGVYIAKGEAPPDTLILYPDSVLTRIVYDKNGRRLEYSRTWEIREYRLILNGWFHVGDGAFPDSVDEEYLNGGLNTALVLDKKDTLCIYMGTSMYFVEKIRKYYRIKRL